MRAIELKGEKLVILDQSLIPREMKYIECEDVECVAEAIENLRVRGAPAIGVTVALALGLTAVKSSNKTKDEVLKELETASERLRKTRPTAVNLFWAIDRVLSAAKRAKNPAESALKEALRIYQETLEADKKISQHGAELIEDGDVILTHCNAGALATAGFGTALGVIKAAHAQGKKIKVFADETRPLLQGARLTAFELVQENIPVTVIVDSAAAFAMKNYCVSKVLVGADRIAANGDTANKIGTYSLAVLAKEHRVPFYVAAPLSTIDMSIKSSAEIPIEFRNRHEIEYFNGKPVVAEGAEILNPAFDVTPGKYISAIITEKGVLRKPYAESIARALGKG